MTATHKVLVLFLTTALLSWCAVGFRHDETVWLVTVDQKTVTKTVMVGPRMHIKEDREVRCVAVDYRGARYWFCEDEHPSVRGLTVGSGRFYYRTGTVLKP